MTPPHRFRLNTAADLSFEPDDGLRRELHDGVVHVAPPAGAGHSKAVLAVYRALFATKVGDARILHDVGVHVGVRRLYVPDLVVVGRETSFHDHGFDADGVLLVVEAVSSDSTTMDRMTKPAVYAEQGIPYFWRIDGLDDRAPRLQAFRLAPSTGVYVLTADLWPEQSGAVTGPWEVVVDMEDLRSDQR